MDNRNAPRRENNRKVECRADGKSIPALIYNISVNGCMLEAPSTWFAEGERISLKMHGNIRISGVIIWQADRNVGVRFDSQLHEAVVRFLGYDPKQSTIHAYPTDRFGRILSRLPQRSSAILTS